MKVFLLLALLTWLILAMACTAAESDQIKMDQQQTPQPANERTDSWIRLERTGCYGSCPVYTLTISSDGSVVYEGKQFVEVTGQRTDQISPEKFDALRIQFEQIDFFSLEDRYTKAAVSDHETVITTFTVHGKTKRIEHAHGDLNAPDALTQLERKIDEVVDSARWTGQNRE